MKFGIGVMGSPVLHERAPECNNRKTEASDAWTERGWRTGALRTSKVTSWVAAYRLLAYLVGQWRLDGQPVDLYAWEHPWVRTVRCADGTILRVQLPAVAVLDLRTICEQQARASS